MAECLVFFRNDDVNRMEPGLVETTDLLLQHGAPISHAVEPANLTTEARDWLLERSGSGVEIIQHGYSHERHDVGEFGGSRSCEDQRRDLNRGLEIMNESFGESFFKAMSFPFGAYNEHTMAILCDLDYQVVSCAWRHRFQTQIFYAIGRALQRGRFLKRHIPYHLGRYIGTGLAEISVTISPIASYHGPTGNRSCVFRSQAELQKIFRACRKLSPVVGVVLHHRFHQDPAGLSVLSEFLTWLRDEPDVRFTDIEGVYKERSFD